jgi:hypothetical protein
MHGMGGGPFCGVCRKEAQDDADVALFRTAVAESGAELSASTYAFETLVGWLGRVFLGEPTRRAERVFGARTPEDIRAWRRTAGVRTRS